MKLKYRNITIPYRVKDNKLPYTYYVYNDKEYKNLNSLFKDFLGSYLIYHFQLGNKEKEVHSIQEVIEALYNHIDDFKIPKKYNDEYSENELYYIKELQKELKKGTIKPITIDEYGFHDQPKDYKSKKLYNFYRDTYNKYKKETMPKKFHSSEYDRNFYCIGGRVYENIIGALGEVYTNELYYQFGGTKNPNNRTHLHAHDFEELIWMIFRNSSKFKIHVHQGEYYSKQELEFLTSLSKKLTKLKFKSVSDKIDMDAEEYFYLKDNRKYLKLLIYNTQYILKERKIKKEILNSHKI